MGKTSDEIRISMGEPESIGRTAFGDLQWTYPNPEALKEWDGRHRKFWIVFDQQGRVKEEHKHKVCWLSEDIARNLNK